MWNVCSSVIYYYTYVMCMWCRNITFYTVPTIGDHDATIDMM